MSGKRKLTGADYRGILLTVAFVAGLAGMAYWKSPRGEYQASKGTQMTKVRLDDGREVLVETEIYYTMPRDLTITVVERRYESGRTTFTVPTY